MSLVSSNEVSKVLGLHKLGFIGISIGWVLLRLTKLQAINRFYDQNKSLPPQDFLHAVLDHFKINFQIPEEDFKRLPKSGPFITGCFL
jgi:hypothetical protein